MAGPAREGQFNLDGILSELGSFGKYQLLLLLLLSFRDSFLSMCNYHFVFTAADVGSRCYVSECESLTDAPYNTPWLQYTVGNNSGLCRRLAPIDHVTSAGNSSLQANDSSLEWGERCVPEMFDESRTVACDKIVYDDYNSIVAEFDLACQPWKRTLIGTVHNLGLIFSYILSGLVSDKYGRKVVIVGTPLVVGVAGLLKSFSVNYWMLIVLEFMETAFGYGTASIVMSLEAVNQNNRVVFSCLSDLLSSFGSAFFSLIAWKVPYWRNMMRAIYAPLLVVLFYIFLMDEGVRWLLAHNKNNEAVRILNKVAKVNGVTLSNAAKEMLTTISDERSKVDKKDEPKKQESHNIIQALKSKTILLRVALISGCSVCSTFVFTGAIINSTNISGNPYLNLAAMQLVSIPTRVVSALTLTRFGRKAPLCIAYCFCACCFVASAFIPKSHGWASTMLYVAGKMGSSYGTFGLFVVAMESFPTTSRNSLVNIVSTLGRVGSVLAPQAPLLSQHMHGLPSVVFGLAALGACLLSLLLPDTSQAALPEDVAQAENIDRTDEKEKQETA